jgi:hyperosmotically inducible periplasmic protein
MRLPVYCCAAALSLLAVAGCDRTPPADKVATATDNAAATTADEQHSDPLITARIQAKYFASPDVKAHRIDVDTRNGLVTLDGTVDSEAQREAAASIARTVDGVTRVENKLLVRPAADTAADAPRHHAPDPSNPMRDGRTPAWITAKIQSQYYLNPTLKPWRIDVDTSSSGAVTLSGTVDSDGDRAEAVKIARATEGVTAVSDNLRVQPQSVATSGTVKDTTDVKNDAREIKNDARSAARKTAAAIDDSWITMKIQSKFFVDDDVRARKIDVDTKDGMVTLKGSVESEGERQHALSIARATDGVTMVHDSLVVDAAKPRRQGTAARGGDAIDDAWITMKIQSKYFIHDEIKSRKVDVDTRNGVVTLNGSVPSATARGAAEVIAQDTDGVSRVINRLTIEPSN